MIHLVRGKGSPHITCRVFPCVLAFFWIAGLLSGALAAFITKDILVSLMLPALNCRVSIVGLLVTVFLPLPIYLLFTYRKAYFPAFLFYSIKGLLLGYCQYGCLIAFGSAGWLACIMLVLPDLLMTIVWFWLFLEASNGVQHRVSRNLIVCICCGLLIVGIYFLRISPLIISIASRI